LHKKITIKSLFTLLLFCSKCFSQETNIGFNISLNAAIGSHFQRLGANFNFYVTHDFFQANSELRAYFNFKNLGAKKTYPELVLSQGVLFAYGSKQDYFNPFFNSVSNQTGYKNSIAYSFNAYFNKIKTTQQTGIISLQFGDISFITENDLLARPQLDRFRTAAMLVQYQYRNQFQAALNCSLWTGKMGNQTAINSPNIYTGCYMDTTGGVYANTSHGLLSAQFKYFPGNVYSQNQNVQANLGIDAEQIRNAMQNKFMHDMRFLPRNWRTKNCHIPMIDDKGNQFLYMENQQVRKAKLYWNLFSNANLFY